MREWLRFHGPTVGAFLGLSIVAGALSLAIAVPSHALESGSPLPVGPIPLPGPGEDADHDSYADAVDHADGDLQVGLRLLELRVPGRNPAPYVLLGTDDDHWRTGKGAPLEWRHVVDPDSLGHRPGSARWQESVLRTGAWWMSRPGDGLDLAIAETGRLSPPGATGAYWPQTMWANVRDDRPTVTLHVELRDGAKDPHAVRGAWDVEVDIVQRQTRIVGEAWQPLPGNLSLELDASRLFVQVMVSAGPPRAALEAIAQRWAPTLRFDSEEAFVPLRGELLERFHGFTRRGPGDIDLRTWDFGFNGGRDQYRLFLGDFNGDGHTTHGDARLMAEVLGAGDLGTPAVYGHVGVTTDDQVVVQYWFLYLFNFVLDDAGREVVKLQHKGDREFVQLTFDGIEAARNGTPTAIAFSQHYEGLLVDSPRADQKPLERGRLVVAVARGSHANFPVPGDDLRLRSSLTSIYDRFDGQGVELGPGNYTLELLGDQPWHAGYKWGPTTRYTRDLGTSSRPLLQHDFRYPFTDPLWWQASLPRVAPDDLDGLYGRSP